MTTDRTMATLARRGHQRVNREREFAHQTLYHMRLAGAQGMRHGAMLMRRAAAGMRWWG